MTEEELNRIMGAVKAQRPIHWEVAEELVFEVNRLRDALEVIAEADNADYARFADDPSAGVSDYAKQILQEGKE